jgi:hypothetical protein
MVRKSFLADLFVAAPLPMGVRQFNAIGIGYSEYRWIIQKTVCPSLMDLEKAEESCPH